MVWWGVCVLLCAPAIAQTLAHPGWVGSGMNIERWWRHAVMFDVSAGVKDDDAGDGNTSLRGVVAHMDDLQALGVDAIVVRDPPPLQPVGEAHADGTSQGASRLELFDDLVQQASRRRLRVLIALQASSQEELTAQARFWLNRGIAGIYLAPAHGAEGTTAAANAQPAMTQADKLLVLRTILKGYAGERIVISEVPADTPVPAVLSEESAQEKRRHRAAGSFRGAASSGQRGSDGDPEMVVVRIDDPAADVGADAIRASLQRTVQRVNASRATPLLALGETQGKPLLLPASGDAALGKVEAAILLGLGAPALVEGRGLTFPPAPISEAQAGGSVQAPQPPADRYAAAARAAREAAARDAAAVVARHSLYEWYRRLNALAHGNATLRSGGTVVLNRDADKALVWVRTPKGAGPVVVLACNLSGRPVTFSLIDDLQRLHFRGSFLKTLLRSFDALGGMSLGAVTLPPYGVYIGELSR